MWDFSFSRFRTISQVFCPAQSGFSPVHQLGTLPKWLAERRVTSGCGQMILKFQSANMLNALHLGVFKKVGEPWSLYSQRPAKYFPIGRGFSRWCFESFPQNAVAGSWWHADARPQDGICAKEYFPSVLNLSWIWWNWLIWQPWRIFAEARSHVLVQWITFQVCWNMVISSQTRQNKYKHRMMWLSAEMYCVWGGL